MLALLGISNVDNHNIKTFGSRWELGNVTPDARAVRSNLTTGWSVTDQVATLIHPDYVFNLYANETQIQRQSAGEKLQQLALHSACQRVVFSSLVDYTVRRSS